MDEQIDLFLSFMNSPVDVSDPMFLLSAALISIIAPALGILWAYRKAAKTMNYS